jgi:type IV secretory pathway VirB4 component
LPEADRQAHTYITGKTGSGKSELLKILIHSYARPSYKGSVVVIDPHGDFAEQVARFPEIANSGRLVYIAPLLSPAYSPTINPFDISDRSLGSVAIYTEQLIAVFERLFALSNYNDLSGHMKAILSNCIATLLRTPGSTINDLLLFMNDETNEHLVKLGKHPREYESPPSELTIHQFLLTRGVAGAARRG